MTVTSHPMEPDKVFKDATFLIPPGEAAIQVQSFNTYGRFLFKQPAMLTFIRCAFITS